MKEVKGFENYLISENGEILNSKTGRILKPQKNTKGYLQVQISVNGKSKSLTIHVEVFKHFCKEIEKGYDVNHIDGNKNNNNIKNLEIVTRKENMIKAVEIGLIKSGLQSPLSVQVSQINPITKEIIETFGSINIAYKKTGVYSSAISSVVNGHRKSAGGFLWEKLK